MANQNRRNRSIAPVYPRKKDERQYYQSINSIVQNIQSALTTQLAVAGSTLSSWLSTINDTFKTVSQDKTLGMKEAQTNLKRIKDYHTQQFFKKAKAALGVDVKPLLHDLFIDQAFSLRLKENIALIKSIPVELHPQLVDKITEAFQKEPFNQKTWYDILQQRFNVASSRAKLIARDQTSKAIGEFTKIRQQQIGIDKYVWSGIDDGRERPSHVANNNKTFEWNNPPSDTGHPGSDFQCRCVAISVIEF
jgi:SPP1 gp7 family putative phage head morphogenesis protein